MEKQRKVIEKQTEKQVEDLKFLDLNNQQIQPCHSQTRTIEDISPKYQLNEEAMNKLKRLFQTERVINTEDLVYKAGGTKKDNVCGYTIFWISYIQWNYLTRYCY